MNYIPQRLTSQSISGGVFVSTLAAFREDLSLAPEVVSEQASRLSRINGIQGIAVNTTVRDRANLSRSESLEVVAATRLGLSKEKVLLACVGELGDDVLERCSEFRSVGADAVIVFLTDCGTAAPRRKRLTQLPILAERMDLPVVIALRQSEQSWLSDQTLITSIAENCNRVLGFGIGDQDDVVMYDQNYYALKSVDRPIAVLSSSEGALFHSLNTGGDGVLSRLALIAPYEVTGLYHATQQGRFFDAQALHTKLAPIIALINEHNSEERDLVYRHMAYLRGLLPTPNLRGVKADISRCLVAKIERTLRDISLQELNQ